MTHTHYVFDAYGTLFDLTSAAARHRDAIGPAWERMSQIWRAKQLEYTWVYSLSGKPLTFRRATEMALDYALLTAGVAPNGVRAKLLDAFLTLGTYPEVPAALSALKARGAHVSILSNGDPDMLDMAIKSAGLADILDAAISVSEVGVFKPSMKVYELATKRYGIPAASISFQSSNRWDVAGATAFGFRTVWINRAKMPDEYPDLKPALVVPDLNGLLA